MGPTPSVNWGIITIEIAVLALIIVVVPGVTILFPSPGIPPNTPPPPFCQIQQPLLDSKTSIGVTFTGSSPSDSAGEYIGLSSGDFAFDVSGPDGLAKCQASQALKKKRILDAQSFWQKALSQQSNDAEALIYQENQRISTNPKGTITFIVGATLTGNIVGNRLDILQGAFAAQKLYNQTYPDSPPIRLLIANFGSQQANAILVARQIVTVASRDSTVAGMVGLPPIARSSDVIGVLSQGNFPLILPTGSTGVQEEGPNIFHVAASTKTQGEAAATYAEKNCPTVEQESPFDCVGQNITLFEDVENSYSYSLGEAFANKIRKDPTNKTVSVVYYKSGDANSIIEKVKNFGNAPPNLIYFAGDAANADTLLQALPQGGAYANLRVLGGDALYQPGSYHADVYRRLDMTAFAYPDEWGALGHASDTPGFFCDYPNDFAGGPIPECDNGQSSPSTRIGYGYSRPENDVILSYDAMWSILQACKTAVSEGMLFSRNQLTNVLHRIDASHAIQGASGHIAFGSDGNPIEKVILMLRVDAIGQTRLENNFVVGTL